MTTDMSRDYDTFAEAYVDGISALLSDGQEVEAVLDDSSFGSRFGTAFRPTVELRPFVFRVRDPAACLIACEPRQPDLGYAMGQWLWTMSGSDSLDRIAYYNPVGKLFSEDGSRLPGAFGARMRRNAGDQLERAIDLLRRDPGSRRAVVVLAEAGDSRSAMRDFPCATGLHFLLRGGKLEVTTSMRSQSALMVFPYDAALFMMLHVWVAGALGVECGPHTWVANSFHIYEDELQQARGVRSRGAGSASVPTAVASPAGEKLERLQRLECELRADPSGARASSSEGLDDPAEFHGAIAAVLFAKAASRSSDAVVGAKAAEHLPASWRSLWQSREKAAAQR
jgi:thymidylate synthase